MSRADLDEDLSVETPQHCCFFGVIVANVGLYLNSRREDACFATFEDRICSLNPQSIPINSATRNLQFMSPVVIAPNVTTTAFSENSNPRTIVSRPAKSSLTIGSSRSCSGI